MGRVRNPKMPLTRKAMAKMLNKFGGPKLLGERLGVTKVTMYNWINQFGVKRVVKYE